MYYSEQQLPNDTNNVYVRSFCRSGANDIVECEMVEDLGVDAGIMVAMKE